MKKSMPVKGIKDTEKAAPGAIRTAIQTWLAPESENFGERLTYVQARLRSLQTSFEGFEVRVERLERRVEEDSKSLRGELSTRFETLRSELEARFDAVRC